MEDSSDGRVLGEMKVSKEIDDNLIMRITPLYNEVNLCLVFRGSSSFINIDSFSFK